MCYPKPGPRCSGHARQRLEAACDAYDTAVAERDRTPEPSGPWAPETDEYRAKEAADSAVSDAALTYADATREFQSTPDGMRELEDRIDTLTHQHPTSQQHLARLNHDLLQGRVTRQQQMAQFAATNNPVAQLPNSDLKSELGDLIDHRMPTMADDPDGLVVEQARFNAVLDEITARRDSGTWRGGRDLPAGDPGPVVRAQRVPVADTTPEEASPFGSPSASYTPAPVVAPKVPTVPTDAWSLSPGNMLVMPGEGEVRVTDVVRHPNNGTPFADVSMHNPNTGETKTRRYAANAVMNRMSPAPQPHPMRQAV